MKTTQNTKSVSLLRFGKEERSILLPTRALGGNKSVPFAETIKSNYSRLETSAEKQYSPQTLGLKVQKEQKRLENEIRDSDFFPCFDNLRFISK